MARRLARYHYRRIVYKKQSDSLDFSLVLSIIFR